MRRNNVQKAFYIVVIAIFLLLVSCTSIPTDGDIVAGNSRAAGQLEATIEALDRTTANSRERIGAVINSSRSIEDGISRLEYLFKCYEREVIELQRAIDKIRAEVEDKD